MPSSSGSEVYFGVCLPTQGYKQRDAYIVTQGPLEKTVEDDVGVPVWLYRDALSAGRRLPGLYIHQHSHIMNLYVCVHVCACVCVCVLYCRRAATATGYV